MEKCDTVMVRNVEPRIRYDNTWLVGCVRRKGVRNEEEENEEGGARAVNVCSSVGLFTYDHVKRTDKNKLESTGMFTATPHTSPT